MAATVEMANSAGMSEDDAMLKVADLYNVVGEHVIAYVSCAVNPSLYRAMFKRFPKADYSSVLFLFAKDYGPTSWDPVSERTGGAG